MEVRYNGTQRRKYEKGFCSSHSFNLYDTPPTHSDPGGPQRQSRWKGHCKSRKRYSERHCKSRKGDNEGHCKSSRQALLTMVKENHRSIHIHKEMNTNENP